MSAPPQATTSVECACALVCAVFGTWYVVRVRGVSVCECACLCACVPVFLCVHVRLWGSGPWIGSAASSLRVLHRGRPALRAPRSGLWSAVPWAWAQPSAWTTSSRTSSSLPSPRTALGARPCTSCGGAAAPSRQPGGGCGGGCCCGWNRGSWPRATRPSMICAMRTARGRAESFGGVAVSRPLVSRLGRRCCARLAGVALPSPADHTTPRCPPTLAMRCVDARSRAHPCDLHRISRRLPAAVERENRRSARECRLAWPILPPRDEPQGTLVRDSLADI